MTEHSNVSVIFLKRNNSIRSSFKMITFWFLAAAAAAGCVCFNCTAACDFSCPAVALFIQDRVSWKKHTTILLIIHASKHILGTTPFDEQIIEQEKK